MSIFSIFSGKADRNAAAAAALQLQNSQAQINQLIQQTQAGTNERIQQGQTGALAAIDAGQAPALTALGTGFGQARTAYGDASARLDPYAQTGGSAFKLLADSYGVNGAGGNANAVGAFQASPGYQWNVDQATDQTARKAAALGILGGGNTLTGIQDRAGNLANQEYAGWRGGLSGLANTGYGATTAQANLGKGIGDLYAQQGAGEADIYGGTAARRAGVFTGLAGTGVGADVNLAGLGVNSLGNTGRGVADDYMKALTAGNTAGANALNFGLNTAGVLAKLAAAFAGPGGMKAPA